eukprot:702168-Rhodomonas_salina.1
MLVCCCTNISPRQLPQSQTSERRTTSLNALDTMPSSRQQSLRTMLSMHDRTRVHTTIYCLQEEDPTLLDDLMDFADDFRDLSGSIWHTNRRAAALEAADVIASDNINILLHLSDTSQGRRHEAVLSLRVAPIQVCLRRGQVL